MGQPKLLFKLVIYFILFVMSANWEFFWLNSAEMFVLPNVVATVGIGLLFAASILALL